MTAALESAREVLRRAGQGHLVDHARTLGPADEARLLEEAAAQPWAALRAAARDGSPAVRELRPPQALTWRRQASEGGLRERIGRLGWGLLSGGRVATLLLAGGQGTRLGHPGPKGEVVFGPDDDRTLFRIHGERVAAVSRRAGRPVPLLVLVSPSTEEATRRAFEAAPAWGLEAGQVRFLVQGVLPCLDEEGRALLAGPGQLATAPDGHGGAFAALRRDGALEALLAAGVDVLTTFQVDNPLARPLDAVMLGWMVERRLEAVGKAVRKRSPAEKVGVFARDLQGRTRVVEYTELPPREGTGFGEPARAADLVLGSIAVHGFAVPWLAGLARAGHELPLHRARKPVPAWRAPGVEAAPTDAWKLERFLFDLFPSARRAEVQEVRRSWEFAPVKNATGEDSLDSARALVIEEVRRWHRERDLPEPEAPGLRPLELDGGREAV